MVKILFLVIMMLCGLNCHAQYFSVYKSVDDKRTEQSQQSDNNTQNVTAYTIEQGYGQARLVRVSLKIKVTESAYSTEVFVKSVRTKDYLGNYSWRDIMRTAKKTNEISDGRENFEKFARVIEIIGGTPELHRTWPGNLVHWCLMDL